MLLNKALQISSSMSFYSFSCLPESSVLKKHEWDLKACCTKIKKNDSKLFSRGCMYTTPEHRTIW